MSTKEKVLALLEAHRGQHISGAAMAAQLHISRNAVWKAINEIKRNGYHIVATAKKGYCLCESNDRLSPQGIAPFLDAPVPILVYPNLPSTNITAKEMALSGAAHGTVVLAEGQSEGKGRYGRSFFSPAGCGIYMSVVLHPARLGFSTPTLTTAHAAVCVCEAIEALSCAVPGIKWVNDVFVDGKKVCGISTEAVTDLESGMVQWVVVGVGINFRAPEEGFPADLPYAGAVFAGKTAVTRNQMVAAVVNRLAVARRSEAVLLQAYKQRLMMLNQVVQVVAGNDTYKATARDIDETGRLLVQREDGTQEYLFSGEVRIFM